MAMLFSLLALLSSALVIESYVEPPERQCGFSKKGLEEFEMALKKKRLKYAEEMHIANMYEMRYDYELEKKLKTMKRCDQDGPFRCARIEEGRGYFNTFEYQHPLQTGFAYCKIEDFGRKGYSRYAGSVYYKEEMIGWKIFLYGPRSTMSRDEYKTGPPGSQCPYGKTLIGLCRAPSESELLVVSPTSTLPEDDEEIDNVAQQTNSIYSILLILLLIIYLFE